MLLKHTPKDVAQRAEEKRPVSRKRECTGSVTWDEAVKKLRYCDCGAPIFEFTDDTGTDDWQCFAECSFCDFVTESHWDPQVVLDQWNNRGGRCEECETGICETDEDEICRKCWDKAKTPNEKDQRRGRR